MCYNRINSEISQNTKHILGFLNMRVAGAGSQALSEFYLRYTFTMQMLVYSTFCAHCVLTHRKWGFCGDDLFIYYWFESGGQLDLRYNCSNSRVYKNRIRWQLDADTAGLKMNKTEEPAVSDSSSFHRRRDIGHRYTSSTRQRTGSKKAKSWKPNVPETNLPSNRRDAAKVWP